ncbi:MAG: hypothetical protein IKH12_09405, partial [Clostridia bacterium]|nr:hypothetical protein [Clostridia bacterium]
MNCYILHRAGRFVNQSAGFSARFGQSKGTETDLTKPSPCDTMNNSFEPLAKGGRNHAKRKKTR